MPEQLTINPSGNNETVLNSGDIEQLEWTKTHTGVGTWRATVRIDTDLADRRGDEVHIEKDGAFQFRGFLLRARDSERQGSANTELFGKGIALELERDGNEKTYSNQYVHDAIADYWSNETSFSATVTDQSADDTTSGTQAQEADTNSEFESITSDNLSDNLPLTAQNSNLELEQTCFTAEGESPDTNNGGSTLNDDNFDGEASNDQGEQFAETGDNAEWEFTPGYTIPGEDFRAQVRITDGADGANAFTWYVVDPDGVKYELDTLSPSGTALGTGWDELGKAYDGGEDTNQTSGDFLGPDLEAGETWALRLEIDDGGGANEFLIVDVVAPHDNGGDRFTPNYTFDNTVDTGNDTLDGPELFPEQVELEFNRAATTWSINTASVSSTWNDTSNKQRIQLKLPPDGTYGPTNGDEDNTTSITDFGFGSDQGTAIQARVRFSRFTNDGTTTPATGDDGQELQDWEITFDGDDIPVITDSTLEGRDDEILGKLHDQGRMRYVVTHAPDSKTVESFPTDGITKSAPEWTIIGKTRVNELGVRFANHVTVRGQRDSDGNRLKTTVSDSTSINNFGQIHSDEKDPELDTQTQVERVARQLLKKRLAESDVTAKRRIVSLDFQPGFSYTIELQDGTTTDVPSEEVRYRVGQGETEGMVLFDVPGEELQERLSRVDSGLRGTKLAF